MALDSFAMQRIIKEVTLGMKPSKDETPEEKAFRLQVTPEIEEAKEKGAIIDFTPEIPFID